MDKVNFRFPSEPTGTDLAVPSGSSRGRQRASIDPSSPATTLAPSRPDSGYVSPGNLHTRRGPQKTYDSPTLNLYRPSPLKESTQSVRVGSKIYTFVRMIEPPTNAKGMMSDGVRILKDLSGELVVEKRLRMDDKSSKDRAGAEVKALEQIKNAGGSPHINRLVEALFSKGDSHSSLILEYCDQGSLKDVIDTSRRCGELLSEQFCWHVFLQLSSALALCHNGVRDPLNPNDRPREWNTLCHIDIKPANIFLQSKKVAGYENVPWPTVVLGDFGCAVTKRDVKDGKVSCNMIPFGTDGWYPPEANSEEIRSIEMGLYGRQTDIWQLGGLVLVMCHKLNYPDMRLVASERPCSSNYTTALSQAVQNCMARKPSMRPTAIDVFRGVRGLMQSQEQKQEQT